MALDSAERIRDDLAKRLGVASTREGLAAVPVARMLEAQAALKSDLMSNPDPERWGYDVVISMLPWQPTVDGDIIPERPIDRIAAGSGADIQLLAGSALDEWHFFLAPSGAMSQIPIEVLTKTIAAYGLPVESTLDTYRAMRPGADAGELLSALQGDWYIRIPTLRLAEAHVAAAAPTYVYEFAWRSPSFGGRLGACHGLDIAFVFDNLPVCADPLLGPSAPHRLADRMHSAWVAFAKTGDPGWTRYDLDRRPTMRFNEISEVLDDPQSPARILWEGVR